MIFDEEEAQEALANQMAFSGDELQQPVQMDAQVIETGTPDAMDDVLGLADADFRMVGPRPAAMPMAGTSDVTMSQRAEASKPDNGFDWSRAFWAAGGGGLGEFDAQRNRKADQVAQKEAAFDQKRLVQEGMDPQSPISRSRQTEYAQTMGARAKIAEQAGMGQLAKMFAEQAQMAPTMSATQIERNSQNYGGLMKESLGAMDSMAKREAIPYNREMNERKVAAAELQAKNTGAQGWARINEAKDEHELRRLERQDVRDDKREAANTKKKEALPGGTQVDEHIAATQTAQDIKRALELLPHVSYIGAGAKAANAISGALPNALDPRTDVDREFANLVQTISAPERHRLFGSALSKGEDIVSQELLPSLGKNPKTVAEVLTKMGKNVGARVGKQRTLYPGLNKIAEFSDSGPDAAMVERAKVAASQGNAKAAQWLKDNGHAP